MVAATAQTQTPSQSLVEASFVPARAEGGPAARRRVRALVYACREAMVNAARHSGARGVSVCIEVEEDRVTAFVRDQGVGFARTSVPADRRGSAESMEGCMERNGGVAVVESSPGRGTEVRLRMPRSRV
jgi:signal transduction histidine kinase